MRSYVSAIAGGPEDLATRYRCTVCQFAASYTGTFATGSSACPRTWSAPFSPIIMVGAFRLPVVMVCIMDESITRTLSTPITRHAGSTTDCGSSGRPMKAKRKRQLLPWRRPGAASLSRLVLLWPWSGPGYGPCEPLLYLVSDHHWFCRYIGGAGIPAPWGRYNSI